MQHRQDNLLANRNLLPGMVSGQCAFKLRTFSPVARYFSLLPCLCILSFSSPAAMLSPGDRSAIQQQQQQLLDENQRQRDALERSAPLTITPSPETSAGTEGPCFTVSRIVVSGATRLTSAETDRLVAPWVNQCLNITGLTAVTDAVTDGYIRRGYITSRAFLTEQDLSGGVLHITVMEGRLQQIRAEGADLPARTLKMVFPGMEGKVLNLRDLEQGMEQINRLRTEPVQIEISPGDREGWSVVTLTASPECPVTGSVGIDNSGQKNTGTGQLNGVLSFNNPLGLADNWFVSGGRSSDFSVSHDARNFAAGVSLPYGYTLVDYTYSWSDYLSTIDNRAGGGVPRETCRLTGWDCRMSCSVTTTDSGKTVTINSGRDTVLNGAQVNGNRIIADVGHDLLISSQQDTSKYDSKQTSVAAGGSFTFGSMTGSGYIAASRDKMKSRFDSVAEQTGMFAGDGGFDITVGKHTQLDGAVIASTATPDKNHLDTGTLGFSDLHNEADYKVSHSGISLSGGGSFGDKFQGNMPGGMISAGGHSGHAEGTTQAAVAEGTIIIRDRDNQKQNLANLSRDPAHANDSISPIFDKEKEQRRLQTVGLISDIGSQVADIARTEGQIAGEKAKRDPAALNQARAELEAAGKPFMEQDVAQRAYNNGMAASGFGTGGKYQQAIQAATAAVQGLAGGNLSAALAGGAAPYLAEVVKTMTTDPVTGEVNKAANVAAHAVVNAALAVAQGNNALASAAGAATGEVVGIIATQMYGKPVSELSETEKQTVSTLATVAAGLAGGLVGDSGASAVAGAQSGKTTVENNALSFGDGFESNAAAATSWNKYAVDNNLTPEQTQAGLDKIAKGDMPDSTNITKVIVDGYQDGVMIAGAWYLGPAASAGKVLGGGLLGLAANSGYQVYDLNQPQNANKSWDYLGSATSFTTGMMAPGRGVLANTGIAMGGAFFTDGPNTASLAGAGIGAGLGGAFGKYAPTAVGKILGNDPVPGFIYELGGGAVSEFTNGIIKDFNNPQAPEKKENK